MPTEPFEPLLYPEISKVQAKELIDVSSPLLREIINDSTWVFQRCQTSPTTNEPNIDLPLIVLYYHIIEMTDSIECLTSQACVIPAKLPLRSSFEALVGFEYILENDSHRRALCWMVSYIHKQLNYHEQFISGTDSNQVLRNAISTKKESQDFLMTPKVEDIATARYDTLTKILTEPQYQPIEAAYQGRKRRGSEWYSLFSGPSDLRILCRYLDKAERNSVGRILEGIGWEAQYILLYKTWSEITHATDLSRIIRKYSDGSPTFIPLRNAQELRNVTHTAATFLLHATRVMLKHFRPGEEERLKNWYLKEVRNLYRNLPKET